MTAEAFIQLAIASRPDLPPQDAMERLDFKHNGQEGWDESDDAHAGFRGEVVEALFAMDHSQDRALIRYLLKAEIEYAREETMMREPLRQLTFMLYCLGKVEDVPLLIEAKTDACFDAGIGLDLELVFGKNKAETKAYFQAHPDPEYDVLAVIEKYDQYEQRSVADFIAGMQRYYGK